MKKLLLNKVLILGIIFIPFFLIKYVNLSDYNKYPGKIISIDTITIAAPVFKGSVKKEKRYNPEIEYYTEKDTISFYQRDLNYFSSYAIGDKVTVLDKKNVNNQATIKSFWYYFLSIPELIVLLLISFIIYGFRKTFGKQKS